MRRGRDRRGSLQCGCWSGQLACNEVDGPRGKIYLRCKEVESHVGGSRPFNWTNSRVFSKDAEVY